ncbi:MAG: HAMP domain-containing histidine kinase [Tatlockia sp.]|nr:HAMP domain-containing histidine kinase [Tatlockia sp.]
MLISTDLTIRCLFMFQMDIVSSVRWVHIVWVLGVWSMLFGLIYCLKNKPFEFCHDRSIQASCSTWMSTTSLIAFLIGFLFLSFLKLHNETIDMHLLLWNLPIVLMFTMITSVLLGNWFSSFILLPIRYFMDRISSTNTKERGEKAIFFSRVHEFEVLNNFINHALDALLFQLERETKLAAQVAHDIRSPLMALDIVIKRMPEVEEPKRILFRGALNHMKNIVDNLEKKYIEGNHSTERCVAQVVAILDYVLWERQEAFSEKPIRLVNDFEPGCYNLFVSVIPTELKRIVTNIINNAYEAINLQNGEISIYVGEENDKVLITISDSGEGMPKSILNSIFDQGFTTKQHGSGLGLYHAKNWLTKWSGSIELLPNTPNGCKVHIKLPSHRPPPWFVENLAFKINDTVICVDDNVSVFHAWQEQFQLIGLEINLHYCHNKETLIREIKKQGKLGCTYLIDYEFSDEAYTGIELANMVIVLNNPNNRIFLVTSHSNEPKLQRFCEFHKIGIIPKFFAFKIPLTITHHESIQGEIHVC